MINYQNNVKLNYCSFLPFCNSIGIFAVQSGGSGAFQSSENVGTGARRSAQVKK